MGGTDPGASAKPNNGVNQNTLARNYSGSVPHNRAGFFVESDGVSMDTAGTTNQTEFFEALVARNKGRLKVIIYNHIRDRGKLEDALQETLLRAFRAIAVLMVHEKPDGWLVRTAINVAREFNASDSRQLRNIHEQMLHSREGYDRFLLSEHAKAAIEEMPEDQMALLKLHYVVGYTHKEIAEQYGISLDAASQRISRARQQLKNTLIGND